MRHIVKQGQGSRKLQQANLRPPQSGAAATAGWSAFRQYGGGAELLNNHLLPEQYGLCAYSEVDADRLGLGFHIEHVDNKSQNPARTFDYQNLIASAFSSEEGLPLAKAQGWEVFGGHTAGKQGKPQPVDMSRLISPLQPDSARFFAYLSSGEVEPTLDLSPTDHERAEYTIALLNLNSPYLVSLRKAWWDEMESLYAEHLDKGWSLNDLAAVDLLPRQQQLSRFFTLTRQFFGPVAENLLRQHAPQLL